VAGNVVPSTQILVTLMMEALNSSETSILTRATQRNILEETILRSYRRENLKSYMYHYFVLVWACVYVAALPRADHRPRKPTDCEEHREN
jgi:hypothetical protein